MATITKRKRKNGQLSYLVNIRIKAKGVLIHRECKTFRRHALAKAWAHKRENELQNEVVFGAKKSVIFRELITDYIKQFSKNYGRTKNYDLNRLLAYDITDLDVYSLKASDLIKHCVQRNREAKPQTVLNDVIWIRSVLKTMRSVSDHDYSLEFIDEASDSLRREKLIAKSASRNRRPTKEELWRLSRYFATRKYKTPMLHIMWFAIFSARRQGEICSLLWADNNKTTHTGMVRDLKHPKFKDGNHRRFKYPLSAWKIIKKQPPIDGRIFPFNSKTVGAYFSSSCKVLGIDDLHFHDLRHESVSRLFEQGLRIEQVQLVSLHDNWATLKRYTNLNPDDLDI